MESTVPEKRTAVKDAFSKELMFGALLALFWISLQLNSQLSAIVNPTIIVMVFILYFIKQGWPERAETSSKDGPAEQIQETYETINDIAHQIRAPLAGLKMACQQLSEDPSDQELVRVMVKTFPREVDKIMDLTKAISKHSKKLESKRIGL